jgi:hypothetical protein
MYERESVIYVLEVYENVILAEFKMHTTSSGPRRTL